MLGDSRKLLAAGLFTALLIVAVNVAWWVFYDRTEHMLERQLSRRLTAVAATSAAAINTGLVEGLVAGDFNSFARILTVLEEVRSADSLSEVFVLDQNFNYLVTTSLDEDTTYFLAPLNAPYIDTFFFGLAQRAVATPSYRIGGVYLKTAFAPLEDSTGFTVAVLGVEANVDYFDDLADLRRNLYFSTGLSLAVGLLFGIIFLLVQRRLNRVQRQLFLSETQSFLGRMVAVVSHEIKNPLMIIRASAERLRKKADTPESGFIVEEVDRLNDIVNGYLDFAAGGGAPRLVGRDSIETFDLGELAADLRNYLVQKYPSDTIEWIGSEPFPPVRLTGHRRSLRQVLLNLFINAADACREAGRPVEVGIDVRERGDAVDILVRDHGPGIPRQRLRRIFEPFYTTRQSGSGLGLYLTKKIVGEMGGDVFIESVVDKGTEVKITLPKKVNA